MELLLCCTCLALLLLLPCAVFAAPDSQGTEFFIGFMENELLRTFHKPNDIELFLATNSPDPVQVNVTTPLLDPNFKKVAIVYKGSTESVSIAHRICGVGTEKSNKGVLITATDEISVYSVNKEHKSTDAYISLPADVLGTEYYAITYLNKPVLLVVATEDDTQINITCPRTSLACRIDFEGVAYNRGKTLQLTLNKFETFHALGGGGKKRDFTGTHITSTKPVSVISGNRKAAVGTKEGLKPSADHLTEMLTPVNTWGKTFITTSTPDRSVGDIFRIVASENDTVVSLYDSTELLIARAGQFLELDLPSGQYQTITSDKPVLVTMFAKTYQGLTDGTRYGDPSMSLIIPEPQYAADYTWSSVQDPTGAEFDNKVSVIIDKDEVSGLVMDNDTSISWEEEKEVLGSPDKVHLWARVDPGSHTLYHQDPTVTFMALVSGTFKVNSYAYPAGLRLAAINEECKRTDPALGDIIDNDCDGEVDEEMLDGIDNDGDGKIDEDLAVLPRQTFVCRVAGDPHLRTFNERSASIPIPCTYRVATLVLNDLSGVPAFNQSLIKIEISASNEKHPSLNRFFVSEVAIKVSLSKVDTNGVNVPGSVGHFQTGSVQIEDFLKGIETDSAWGGDLEGPLKGKVNLGYDVTENMADLTIEGASPRITFRPLNKSQGIPQTLWPGLIIKMGSDQISYQSAAFPNTMCSTEDDTGSPAKVARREGLTVADSGIFAVLDQQEMQTLGSEQVKCTVAMDVYNNCPKDKTSALLQCSPLLTQPALAQCLSVKFKVAAFEVFLKCLTFVCEDNLSDCEDLKAYAAICPDLSAQVALGC
ncbi:IgGFc-binding protein-like isoform X2 [Littorina saxatilis]|uniref:IgGFc-binding protein N-terminal domain-containing protein n=2 Tax=Littorina saxatilis TaxID=31220 RepID=A0AAN9B6G0_9CAEN